MSASTKIWLLYSALGFVLSFILTSLFDAYPHLRFISNEGVIFGVMCAVMGSSLKKLAVNNNKQTKLK